VREIQVSKVLALVLKLVSFESDNYFVIIMNKVEIFLSSSRRFALEVKNSQHPSLQSANQLTHLLANSCIS